MTPSTADTASSPRPDGAGNGAGTAAPPVRPDIIAAATRVFSERGYHAASMSEIADEVGIRKPSLYHHVRKKEDLLFAIHETLIDEPKAGWPLVVAQRTEMYPVTVGLVEYVGQFFVEYHLFTTASVLVMLPVFVLYLFLQRYIIEGVAMQGLKG